MLQPSDPQALACPPCVCKAPLHTGFLGEGGDLQNFKFVETGTLSLLPFLRRQQQSRAHTDVPTTEEAPTQLSSSITVFVLSLLFVLRGARGTFFALKPKDVLKTLFTEIVLVIHCSLMCLYIFVC